MSQQQFQSSQFNNNIPIKGDTALTVGFNVLPVMLDPASTKTLYPGDAVVMTTSDGTAILVDKAAATDVPFGYVLYKMKNNIFSVASGSVAFEIARFGTMVWAQAQGSIDRGDFLEYVPDLTVPTDDPLMKANAGVNPISAIAVDNAGDGDIFRMIIITQTDFAPVVTGGTINNTPIGQATPNLGAFTVLQGTSLTVSGATITKTLADAIVALTPAATISVDPTLGGLFTLVPGASCTLNAASVNGKHQSIVIVITTSGTTSYTVTFGTSFKSAGTLATGATSGKVFVVRFEGDGTNYNEASRTTAL